jgi:hypothetical protein
MNRRRRKLIRLDLQLKIVFITLFVASLVLLVNFQLTLASLWSLSEEFLQSNSIHSLLQSLEKSTLQKFLISVVMAVPLAASVGILYSFKFCGPIYRFKKYFTDLQGGRWDERCMLRKGDDLQDLCDTINQCVDGFRQSLRTNHLLLQDVESFLREAAITADGQTQLTLQRIREGITFENEEFSRRFGDPADASPSQVPVGSSANAPADGCGETRPADERVETSV